MRTSVARDIIFLAAASSFTGAAGLLNPFDQGLIESVNEMAHILEASFNNGGTLLLKAFVSDDQNLHWLYKTTHGSRRSVFNSCKPETTLS